MTDPSLAAQFTAVVAEVLEHVQDSQLLKLPHFSVDLPPYLSAHGVMMIAAAALLFCLGILGVRQSKGVPRGLGALLEIYVLFIRDHMMIPYLGEEDGRKMTPTFCSLFAFILFMNLLGLMPGLKTATSNVSVTAALAVVSFYFMTAGAARKTGVLGFFKGLIPSGIPWPILILLVPLEIISLFVRTFALCIRLFANMFAGHMVVPFLLNIMVMYGILFSPFLIMAIFIFVLEIFVAFLQAYIFTLLSAVFIGQRYHPSH